MTSVPGDLPPSRGAQVSRPHFRPIKYRAVSPHEQAVIDAGYPWARTNPLIPTWMSPGADPRPQPFPEGSKHELLDRLNWHGHHGVNTNLIVEGDLTLLKPKKYFDQNHVAAVTLSTDLGAPKESPVSPDKVYLGTTQQACKFVEGHRCLSPTSARRYMDRGSIEWVDKTGQVVTDDQYSFGKLGKDGKPISDKEYLLEQLNKAAFETKFDFKLMRRFAICSFDEDNQITLSMRQWFLREWNDPEAQVAKGELRPVIHASESHLVLPPQRQEMDVDAGESDHSSDEVDISDEDGSSALTKAFQQWFQGGIREN